MHDDKAHKDEAKETDVKPLPKAGEDKKDSLSSAAPHNKSKAQEASSASFPITLRLTGMKATDLKNVEMLGKMDPYLKIFYNKQEHRTKHIDGGGRSVSWDKETTEFQTNLAMLSSQELKVEAWDKGMISDTLIGSASVSVAHLADTLNTAQVFDVQVSR